VIWITS